MRTKLSAFNSFLTTSCFDIACIQETWLLPAIGDAEVVGLSGFSIFRADRLKADDPLTAKGGGVAICCRTEFAPTVVKTLCCAYLELVAIQCRLGRTDTIIISVYFPPTQTLLACHEFDAALTDLLIHHSSQNIIMCGDFNMPGMDWILDDDSGHLVPSFPTNPNLSSQALVSSLSNNNLIQMSQVRNNNGVILDLVLTDNPDSLEVRAASLAEMFVSSVVHHTPTVLTLSAESETRNQNDLVTQRNINFPRIYTCLRDLLRPIEPSSIVNRDDVDFVLGEITDVIESHTSMSTSNTYSGHIWLRHDRIYEKMKQNCKQLFATFSRSRGELDRVRYFSALRELREHFNNKKEQHYTRIVQEHNNYRELFLLAKTKTAPRELMPDVMYDNDICLTVAERNRRVAAHLAHNLGIERARFEYQLSHPPIDGARLLSTNEEFSTHDTDPLADYYINEVQLKKIIREIDPKKDPGPMSIPLSFFLNAEFLFPYLVNMINSMIRLAYFPPSLKTSFLVPIPKKGKRNQLKNYRGIALQSVLSKIIDKHLTNCLSLETSSQMDPYQHGFLPSRSTLSNLTEFVQHAQCSFAKRVGMDCIYFDFSKAFDSISHPILKQKLIRLGVHEKRATAILSFVSGRRYIVRINNSATPFIVYPDKGVPQGSHIGPLLYLLYCLDLQSVLSDVHYLMYADDTKIFMPISNPISSHLLQKAIDALAAWAEQNQLKLNADKTFHVHFSKSPPAHVHTYTLNHDPIQRTESHKDLGVIVDSRLKFHLHVSHICARGMQALGVIWRTTRDLRCPGLAKIMFSTYILPVLEYCSQVWDQSFVLDSERIENILRRASRMALASSKLPHQPGYLRYEERLKILGLTTLNQRRCISRCLHAVGVLNGRTYSPSISYLIQNCSRVNAPRTRRPNLFHNIANFAPRDSIAARALVSMNWASERFDISASPIGLKNNLKKAALDSLL